MKRKNWVWFFPPILAFTAISSLVGLLAPDFYHRDSAFMAMKASQLDIVHLAIVVPLGVVMFVPALRGRLWARLFVLGIIADLAYMFGFNAFALYFNELFLVYVAVFGLCLFGMVLGYRDVRATGDFEGKRTTARIGASFLLLFSVTAFGAWLMEIVSATLSGSVPHSIAGTTLPTGAVHVLDMAFVLPLIIVGAVLLWRGKMSGLILSTVSVTFAFLVCISILVMELALQRHGLHSDPGQMYSMFVLVPLSIYPLISLNRVTALLE